MRKDLTAISIAAVAALVAMNVYAAATNAVEKEVRHELLTLSRYGVFDNISYKVEGGTVILAGQVTEPVLKSDAEKAVKGVEGVSQVRNEIEVLPPSPMDEQIRRSVYRAIYGDTDLSRYAFQAIPSIHIIVKNGQVTLEGVVANEMDRNVANIRTQAVGGVFSVTNNLRLDR